MTIPKLSQRERMLVCWLLLLIFAFSAFRFCYYSLYYTHHRYKRDFSTYMTASTALKEGAPIYATGPWPLQQENVLKGHSIHPGYPPPPVLEYLYPPFLAWVLIPLTAIPYPWAQHVWVWGSFLLYSCTVALFICSLRRVLSLSRWELLGLVLLALYWSPVFFALWAGQVTVVILFLLIAHVHLALRWRDGWAGCLLGIAVLIKVNPVVFLVMWGLQCRWRLLLACVCTMWIGVWLSGVDATLQFVLYVLPQLGLGENDPINLSAMGTYMIVQIPYTTGWISREIYAMIAVPHLMMRILLLLGWVVIFRAVGKKRGAVQVWMSTMLIFNSMLLLSPITRIYDYTYLFPSLVMAFIHCRRYWSWGFFVLIAATALVFMINVGDLLSSIPFIVFPDLLIERINVLTFGLFWVVCVVRVAWYKYDKV